MGTEGSNVLRAGVQVVIALTLVAVIIFVILFSRDWYEKELSYRLDQQRIAEQADYYKFNVTKKVQGNDIIEFILKYDTLYDYTIVLATGQTYRLKSEEASKHEEWWTENYLLNVVFYGITSASFDVTSENNNGEIYAYTLTQVKN